jgi:glycerophosphoryl diester phosphodiesterase
MRMAGWAGVQQLLPSLLDPPIMFAHRGAKAYAPENTIDAFKLALKLGANGLESDVWVTVDGVAVLDHDGELKTSRLRKRSIEGMRRDELPRHIPSLSELFDACGTDYHLSLDLKGAHSGPAVIDVVRQHAPGMMPRLWLCHYDMAALTELRHVDAEVKLVDSTRLHRIEEGPERRAARLAEHGIDGINLRQADWNGGLVALFHRFGRTAFSWDLQHEHLLRPAFRMGIDGVYSDYVDRMVDAFTAEIGAGGTG